MEQIKSWVEQHPLLTSWFVLGAGLMGILAVQARDVGLNGSQWFWLMFITFLVAGLCVWIISWGDDEDEDA
ncbi:MAG TPA: hypothetical protein VLL52_03840 [Anaerolineae bacterium]|nr:hypothetical protein [Anaerolineae bacterium]